MKGEETRGLIFAEKIKWLIFAERKTRGLIFAETKTKGLIFAKRKTRGLSFAEKMKWLIFAEKTRVQRVSALGDRTACAGHIGGSVRI